MTERIAIFIDGPSMYGAGKAIGLEIDYKALPAVLAGNGDVRRAFYFSLIAEDGEFEAVLPLLDFLEYNGFTVRTKVGTPYIDQTAGTRRVRGHLLAEIAVEAMALAPHFDTAYLLTSDGNFVALVEGLQRLGKRVLIVSTIHHCSDELRRAADQFIDLETLRAEIARAPRIVKETVSA